MAVPFLKKETFGLRTQETFIGKRCEIYIPRKYFDKGDANASAAEMGSKVRSIGLFWFNVDGKLYELQLPIKFEFEFSGSEKRKMKLKPNFNEEEYNVYILEYGDAFVYDILQKKELENFTKGFVEKIIENARIPATTAYSDVLSIFLNAMDATGVSDVGLSSVSLEFLLSEMFRNKKMLRQPFRQVYSGDEYNYRMVRITKLPEMNSTFTSLIGADVQTQLVASILRKREGAEDRVSPAEEVIKY